MLFFILCWSRLSTQHLVFWRKKCMKTEICLGASFSFNIFFKILLLHVLVGLKNLSTFEFSINFLLFVFYIIFYLRNLTLHFINLRHTVLLRYIYLFNMIAIEAIFITLPHWGQHGWTLSTLC